MVPSRVAVPAHRSMFAPVASLEVPDVPSEVDQGQLLEFVRELSHTVDRLEAEVADLKRRV